MTNSTDHLTITHPAPLDVRETSISAYRDEEQFTIDTSDPVFERLLRTKGYVPISGDGTYLRFSLPKRAITVRSRAAVEHPHQRKNLPPRGRAHESRAAEASKAGENQRSSAPEDRSLGSDDGRTGEAADTLANSPNLGSSGRSRFRTSDRQRSQS